MKPFRGGFGPFDARPKAVRGNANSHMPPACYGSSLGCAEKSAAGAGWLAAGQGGMGAGEQRSWASAWHRSTVQDVDGIVRPLVRFQLVPERLGRDGTPIWRSAGFPRLSEDREADIIQSLGSPRARYSSELGVNGMVCGIWNTWTTIRLHVQAGCRQCGDPACKA
jgi:hypothetical protein